MSTTALTARVNDEEFSRNVPGNTVITVTIRGIGTPDGTNITCTLIREDGYGAVGASKIVVMNTLKAVVAFDLQADCFDADAFFRAKQGTYHVHAVAADNSFAADSKSFDVMIGTAKEMLTQYTPGIDLASTNVVTARRQPQLITGATIENASSTQPKGVFTLAWDVAAKTLSWDGGPAVAVDMTQPTLELTLLNGAQKAYVDVDVATESLPVANQTETLIMDTAKISESDIRNLIRKAYGTIESKLHVYLEPTNISTERPGSVSYDANFFVDQYKDHLTFYSKEWRTAWFALKMPVRYVQKVLSLEGWFNASRVLSVPVDQWIVKNTLTGNLEFVPSQGAVMPWTFYGASPFFLFTTSNYVPSFWGYKIVAGLPDLKNDDVRGRVRNAVMTEAAIQLLTLSGLASAPGLSSESIAKDGVSQSRSYAQGKGGRYSAVIEQYSTFLHGEDGKDGEGSEVWALRKRINGVQMIVL